jgi:hypothetical protein
MNDATMSLCYAGLGKNIHLYPVVEWMWHSCHTRIERTYNKIYGSLYGILCYILFYPILYPMEWCMVYGLALLNALRDIVDEK